AARPAEQLVEDRPAPPAEHLLEDVEGVVDAARARVSGDRRALHAGVAELVVARALLGVGEDLVRLGNLLEGGLGALVPGIAVGVVLQRELAVRLLDVVRGCVPRNPEHAVVVALVRHETVSSTMRRTDTQLQSVNSAERVHHGDTEDTEGARRATRVVATP